MLFNRVQGSPIVNDNNLKAAIKYQVYSKNVAAVFLELEINKARSSKLTGIATPSTQHCKDYKLTNYSAL
jgi:hypothetical protein